jgi:hypothetical protein
MDSKQQEQIYVLDFDVDFGVCRKLHTVCLNFVGIVQQQQHHHC